MPVQNPTMDALRAGGSTANQGMSTANSMMSGMLNAMNNTSQLGFKMYGLLESERARKAEEGLQRQKMIQQQAQFEANNLINKAQLKAQKQRDFNTNANAVANIGLRSLEGGRADAKATREQEEWDMRKEVYDDLNTQSPTGTAPQQLGGNSKTGAIQQKMSQLAVQYRKQKIAGITPDTTEYKTLQKQLDRIQKIEDKNILTTNEILTQSRQLAGDKKGYESDSDYMNRVLAISQKLSGKPQAPGTLSEPKNSVAKANYTRQAINNGSNDGRDLLNRAIDTGDMDTIKLGLQSQNQNFVQNSIDAINTSIKDPRARESFFNTFSQERFVDNVRNGKTRFDKNLNEFIYPELNKQNPTATYAMAKQQRMSDSYKPGNPYMSALRDINTGQSWLGDVFHNILGSTSKDEAKMAKAAGIYDIEAIKNNGFDYAPFALAGQLAHRKTQDFWDKSKNFNFGFYGVFGETMDDEGKPYAIEAQTVDASGNTTDTNMKPYIVGTDTKIKTQYKDRFDAMKPAEQYKILHTTIKKKFKDNPKYEKYFMENTKALGKQLQGKVDIDSFKLEDGTFEVSTDNDTPITVGMYNVETGKADMVQMSFKDASNLYIQLLGFLK